MAGSALFVFLDLCKGAVHENLGWHSSDCRFSRVRSLADARG